MLEQAVQMQPCWYEEVHAIDMAVLSACGGYASMTAKVEISKKWGTLGYTV